MLTGMDRARDIEPAVSTPAKPVGYRIRHKDLKGVMVAIPVAARPLARVRGTKCPTCQVQHQVKTYHFLLDPQGACLVSSKILTELRKAGVVSDNASSEFRFESPVADPPVQRVGQGIDPRNREVRRPIEIHT